MVVFFCDSILVVTVSLCDDVTNVLEVLFVVFFFGCAQARQSLRGMPWASFRYVLILLSAVPTNEAVFLIFRKRT